MNNYIKCTCILVWIFLSSYVLSSQTLWSKYPHNPVLSPGVFNGISSYGIMGGFDDRCALSPSVLYENGLYKMWYVGYENSFYGIYKIGYAVSEDGVSWCTYTKNPVLSVGNPGNFDAQHVWLSVVVKDSGYKMYYSGSDGARWSVGLANSSDGIHWLKYSVNSILSPGLSGSWDDQSVWGVSIIKMADGDYRMWYTGQAIGNKPKIGYATSTDGIHWNKYVGNPILSLGDSASWESNAIYVPRIIYNNNKFHMFYLGNAGSVGTSIGYAYSDDGINWTKYNKNPILNPGYSSQWDSYALIDHCVILQDSTFKIWYGARSTTTIYQIGYATSEYTPLEVKEIKEIPKEFKLYQIYPNPFNPTTTIEYDLAKERQVNITIYNSLGQEIITLVDGQQMAGHYSVVWNAVNYASGIYLCRIKAGDFIDARKVALVK